MGDASCPEQRNLPSQVSPQPPGRRSHAHLECALYPAGASRWQGPRGVGLPAFRQWVAGSHLYDTCSIRSLWKPSIAALPLKRRSARDTHSLPLLVCPAKLIEGFEEFLRGHSYIRVEASFQGSGKEG